MKLSKQSWHYKLNKLYTHGVPRNLCGYFWRTVWYCVALIPTALLFIPFWIISLLDKEDRIFDKTGTQGFVDQYPAVLLLDAILFTGYSMITMFFIWHTDIKGFDAIRMVFGGIGWFLVLIGIAYGIEQKIRERRKGKQKQKRPNIFVEYIKAKKNKYCPIIEWEDENDERIEVLQN
jgi:uncharacterized membrane protein